MPKRLILCDCSGTQQLDRDLIAKSCDVTCSRVHSNLCTHEIGAAAEEIKSGTEPGSVIIACLQEQAVFTELAEECSVPCPDFIDLRDRAGWAENGGSSGPKMAALINDAMLVSPPVKMLEILSDGRCLILGAANVSLAAADQLADLLSVTVLLDQAPEMMDHRGYDVVLGQLNTVTGALGQYSVKIDRLRQINPGGRGDLGFGKARNGGRTECDLILDLSGAKPLFSGHGRDGYLRADPGDPQAVGKAVLAASQLIGAFEKPLYVANNTQVCAHSRAGIVGCSACLDNCASGAISADGDHVRIDPNICAGCGDCVALCPSGALQFEAPETSHIFKRIQNLASSYSSAKGVTPKLLICDAEHGGQMISLAARYGRGLPADVIPLELESTALFGHAEMLAALASGFARVDVLVALRSTAQTQTSEAALANAITQSDQIRLLQLDDPDALSDALFDAPAGPSNTGPSNTGPILAIGTRRQITRLAAKAMTEITETPIPLPQNAPYGALEIDTDACTLCLSCVSLCPAGALSDNPDRPELRFVEDACLQCGLCTRVCPENALTLVPQLDLSDAAMNARILHKEEPFACVSCGSLFGVKSTVEKITSLLAGKHSMFATSEAGKLIQMCDDCRIKAQYHSESQPFQGADRSRTVTTEDYFSKRKDH
ncbi:MAG: 4Fe-4S binding protein [Rhodobacteraceae bacterium]|nr:4Fe-4S binding protein [Paracoccaceae bacterium]